MKLLAQWLIRAAVLVSLPYIYTIVILAVVEKGDAALKDPVVIGGILLYVLSAVGLFSFHRLGRIAYAGLTVGIIIVSVARGTGATLLQMDFLAIILFGILLFLPPLKKAFEI